MEKQELIDIIKKFSMSGWDLIAKPAMVYLEKGDNQGELIAAIIEADQVCGSCGCELDPLYKRFLKLKNLL